MHRFANPARFMRLSAAVLPWCAAATAVLLAVGLYLALFVAPPDYQQGDDVRIMFVHVPAAWLASFIYLLLAVASAVAIIWRHPLADIAAQSAAPLGAVFTALCLVTGSLWGGRCGARGGSGTRGSLRCWCCSFSISATSRW